MERYTKQYIFALLIIAVLALLSNLSLTTVIRSQESSAALINISGRQRMLSQRIALLVSQLTSATSSSKSRTLARQELITAIQLAEESHRDLINPDSYLYQDPGMSKTVHNIYRSEPHNLNELVLEYLATSKRIVAYKGESDSDTIGYSHPDVQLLLQYAKGNLISSMDLVVRQYVSESRNRVIFLKRLANLVLIVTWCTLITLALVIFRPMANTIKSSQKELERDIRERKEVEKHLLIVVEQERARISRELHDSASQQVAGMAMIVKSVSNKLEKGNTPETESLTHIARNLQELGDELRQIIHDLAPMEIENDSLQEVLSKVVDTVNLQTGANCKLFCTENLRLLNHEAEIQLLRIAQEAVHNTKKHANAKSVSIELKHEGGTLFLSIKDDGVGFTTNQETLKGFGLGIMKYRASVIGADLEIDSQVGRGTNVVCSLPYEPAPHSNIAKPGKLSDLG